VTATYAGTDLIAGGWPEFTIHRSFPADADAGGNFDVHRARPWQRVPEPFVPAALLLVLAGIGAAALPGPRLRALAGAVTAVAATGAVVGAQIHGQAAVRQNLADEIATFTSPAQISVAVEARVGFWLALALLVALTVGNIVQLIRHRRRPPAGPEPAVQDLPPPAPSGPPAPPASDAAVPAAA
jgi:hypothetical protein